MKRILLFLFTLHCSLLTLFAQAPQGFNYQAVARDGSGNILSESGLDVRIGLLAGSETGTLVWEEEHTVATNEFGLFTLIIGDPAATRTNGTAALFTDIDWGSDSHYMKIEINPGTGYQEMGSARLMSVPYALFAENAEQLAMGETWLKDGDTIYFNGNIGIGTTSPDSRLEIVGDGTETSEDALFEVKRNDGQTVFAVYPEGVRIYVDDSGVKGTKGGFAVGGFSPVKGLTNEFLRVTPDSVRVYVNDDGLKGTKGGFAVGGFSPAKGITNEYLRVSPDSVRIYVDGNAVKGTKGGFAVGGISPVKGIDEEYLRVTPDSVRVYINDEPTKGTKGGFAVGGYSPVKGLTGDYMNVSGKGSAEIIDPSDARVLWYPNKEAFLSGRVLIQSPDSIGTNSMATGFESKAIGDFSQAMGYRAIARGDYSTAIGDLVVANGLSSFAVGDGAVASGANAFAFGKDPIASGDGSYAFGSNLTGTKTRATSDNSFALGLGCLADGVGAISIGTGNTSSADYSFSAGRSSLANKSGSTAIGQSVNATGTSSSAFGYGTTASGNYSTALGYNTTASGLHSTAMGYNSQAGGQYSFAAGINSNAAGINALAIGNSASAAGAVSIALGASASAGHQNGIAIGQLSKTLDWHAVALGYDNEAGKGAIASGYKSKAYGQYSVATGYQAKTHAHYSVSIGDNTDTQGLYSTSMGFWSLSEGQRSFAMGDNATSKSYGSFVIGRFNDLTSSSSTSWVTTDPLFIVGNGSGPAARSNAFTVLKNGNIGIGTVTPAFKLDVKGSLSAYYYYGRENNDYLEIDVSENFRFISNSIERMRINGSGNVGIGDSSPGEKLEVTGNITLSSGANRYFALPDATKTMIIGRNSASIMPWGVIVNACGYIALQVDGLATKSIYIKDDGNVGVGTSSPSQKFTVYNGSTTGTYTTSGWQHSSDKRLKTNIRPIPTSLNSILKLQGVYFNWKTNSDKREIGFIAQDVEKIIPEIVTKNQNGYYSIAYGNFAPLIVEAIKEQQEIIDNQNSRIDQLEKMLQELLEKME